MKTTTHDLQHDLQIAADAAVFAEEVLGIVPDPWQRKVLQYKHKRLILNCSRQSGKSLMASIKALHAALYVPESLILILSPSLRQSSETFRAVTTMTAKIEPVPKKLEDNRLSVTFANNSRIVSLPAKEEKVRGYSGVDLIIEDESSRVPDELYFSTRPMLAVSGGSLILLSTPFGKRGHFHDIWMKDSKEWMKVSVTAAECPRISEQFLAEELDNLGKIWYEQEYFCRFVETSGQVFSTSLLERALSDKVEPCLEPEEYFTGGDEEWTDIILA